MGTSGLVKREKLWLLTRDLVLARGININLPGEEILHMLSLKGVMR